MAAQMQEVRYTRILRGTQQFLVVPTDHDEGRQHALLPAIQDSEDIILSNVMIRVLVPA